MTAPPVSIVIVSRGRPAALARCLTGLSQLLYPAFEIVVVADSAAVATVAPQWDGRIKIATFDEANISAARNFGIALSSGEFIAFIDDDAVPEPTWLSRLVAPLVDPAVSAAGGYVRGRNGISFQWKGRWVDAQARTGPVPAGQNPVVFAQSAGHALKTEGTNMAFRRSTLAAVGGFDPALRFYLDETDLNLRLAATGAPAVLVPKAQVHHGFSVSDRRRADRVPISLHEVGASLAVFLRRHAGGADPARLADELTDRRRGLIGHMVAGRIEPRDVDRILATLRAGWEDGCGRPLAPLPPLAPANGPFLAFRAEPAVRGHLLLSGRRAEAAHLRAEAAAAFRDGWIVSLYLFSTDARYHRITYSDDGYWSQQGGLFGRSVRSDPLFYPWLQAQRVARENDFVSDFRWSEERFPAGAC